MQFSADQFRELLTSLRPPAAATQGNFADCTARYNGSREKGVVKEFITKIELFKAAKSVNDADALTGLPLLLEGEALTWWQGVHTGAATWQNAVDLIKKNFAPGRPNHEIFMELFREPQAAETKTEVFIMKKRALLTELSYELTEVQQIDLVFGLLHVDLRSKITRMEATSFDVLITKARHVETLAAETKAQVRSLPNAATHKDANAPRKEAPAGDRKKRCDICRRNNHHTNECRARRPNEVTTTTPAGAPSSKPETAKLLCYGCGTPGYVRAKCPNCNKQKPQPDGAPATFCAVSTGGPRLRPVVEVKIAGQTGRACLDTGAKASIASDSLHKLLEQKNVPWKDKTMQVALADGHKRIQRIQSYEIEVVLGGRNLMTEFIVLPGAIDNRTLLGVDFMEDIGLVLNMPQRCWNFVDQPTCHHPFIGVETAEAANFGNGKTNEIRYPSLSAESNKESVPVASVKTGFVEQERQTLDQLFAQAFAGYDEAMLALGRAAEQADPIPVIHIGAVETQLRQDEATALSEEEKGQVNHLLEQYGDIMASGGPPSTITEHRIDTGDSRPIATPPYRLSPAKTEALRHEIGEMLRRGVIVECESPWSSQVVMVPKKDGGVRVCVDFRELNKVTVKDNYSMRRTDDQLHATGKAKCITTVDLRSSFWQIPLRKEDQIKTAFITPFGVYMFLVMAFGLCNASATMQRVADRIIAALAGRRVLAYIDDFVILSDSFEQHLEDLGALFQKLREFGLRINREKCHLMCGQVKFLGHLITEQGLLPDPDKTRAISEMRPPKALKQLQSFLQSCSWFRRFIPNFARVAEPLTRLLKKQAVWSWGPEQQRSFEELKRLLTQPPILQQADPKCPYILRTDASSYAIGACLLQGEKGEEHPVEYASRLLTQAERNYSTTEREALAVVWALDKFRCYVEGVKTTVATDHQPLRWLMSLKTPTGRLARWALLLQPFNLEIKYIPGRNNVVADMLSRLPEAEDAPEEGSVDVCGISIDLPRRSPAETRAEQLKDPELKAVIDAFEQEATEEEFARYSARGYIMSQGVLYRFVPEQGSEEPQLVVPAHERDAILQAFHDDPTAGHYGVERTINRISEKFYWLGMRRQIAEHVKKCIDCQRYKCTNLKPAGLLQTPVMQQRFEVLAVDLFGPLPPSSKDYRWILIIEDTASRWVELFALQEATAEACADTLLHEVILRYGVPRRLVSDNGTQFISGIMQKLTHCLGIKQCFTPLYHPAANPVERRNRDLKTQLAILVGDQHPNWPDKLASIRFAMNTSRCESTGFTAAYLTFGRDLRATEHVQRDLREIIENENFIPEITPKLLVLADTLAQARDTQETEQDRRKKHHDQHRRPSPNFQPGDKVWVENHQLSNAEKKISAKLATRRDGPYVIARQKGPASFEVSHRGQNLGKYHASAITPYQGDGDDIPEPVRPIQRRGRPKKAPTRHVVTKRGRGRPRKQQQPEPLAETAAGPEGEDVTRRRSSRQGEASAA